MEIGQSVIWQHEARGGYGYILPIPATITRINKSRVQIQVKKTNGELVLRWVKPEKLIIRDDNHEPHV